MGIGMKLTRGEWGAFAFTLAYMVIWLVVASISQNREFVYYFAVMCLLLAASSLLHWRVRFPQAALWALSAWGLAHMAGGLVVVPESWPTLGGRALYNLWLIPGYLKYDQVVHACGFGLVTWLCWWGLSRAFSRAGVIARPTIGLLVLCVAAGMGFGAANEVVEFIATLTLPETNVGGYENTGWDLVANLVGSVMAAVGIRIRTPVHAPQTTATS